MTDEVAYGKTKLGQLLYDLAFTNLDRSYLARKHAIPVSAIDRMRASKEIKKLRKQVEHDASTEAATAASLRRGVRHRKRCK